MKVQRQVRQIGRKEGKKEGKKTGRKRTSKQECKHDRNKSRKKGGQSTFVGWTHGQHICGLDMAFAHLSSILPREDGGMDFGDALPQGRVELRSDAANECETSQQHARTCPQTYTGALHQHMCIKRRTHRNLIFVHLHVEGESKANVVIVVSALRTKLWRLPRLPLKHSNTATTSAD